MLELVSCLMMAHSVLTALESVGNLVSDGSCLWGSSKEVGGCRLVMGSSRLVMLGSRN